MTDPGGSWLVLKGNRTHEGPAEDAGHRALRGTPHTLADSCRLGLPFGPFNKRVVGLVTGLVELGYHVTMTVDLKKPFGISLLI